MKNRIPCLTLLAALAGWLAGADCARADLQILLPLARKAYQTNEVIDLAVVRSGAAALPAGDLHLTVAGQSGSRAVFEFPLGTAAMVGPDARDTVHLHLNGWLLRPDKYGLEVAADGQTATAEIDVRSHQRQTSFKLIQWGSRAAKAEQGILGEQSLGLNLIYASYGGLEPDELIRTGADYMWCCTMSGAHQMDIRMECDWSDPYVLRGGMARVIRRAFQDRTRPNAIGVHFYDEPGLTWWKHPATGVMVPFNIPWQDRSFKSIFDQDAPQYHEVDPAKPELVRRWKDMNRWKEQFMEAAWKYSSFGVSRVQPNMLSVTQSVYGATAYADGYYFNVVRSLPIISGHGGYDDYGLLYHNPAYTFQLGRMRQLDKPNWYLPMWYANEPSDRFRMEQYLSFMDNLQGMAVPPDITVQKPESVPASEGVVESNLLMARLGTIFTTQPVDRGDVAVLNSLSQALDAEVRDLKIDINKASYEAGGHTRNALGLVYLASRMIQTQIYPIVEEDVVDGTLAAHYRAIVVPTVNALELPVIRALEAFAASGGLVLVSDDSQVQIKGATKLGVPTQAAIFGKIGELWPLAQNDKAKAAELKRLNNVGSYYQAAAPIAQALQARLKERGIRPAFACDNREVAGTRQAFGDFEYLFAVNAAYNAAEGDTNSIQATSAVLGVPADGRPIYDAIQGGAIHEGNATKFKSQGDQLTGQFRFGPGQMRVFVRTAAADRRRAAGHAAGRARPDGRRESDSLADQRRAGRRCRPAAGRLGAAADSRPRPGRRHSLRPVSGNRPRHAQAHAAAGGQRSAGQVESAGPGTAQQLGIRGRVQLYSAGPVRGAGRPHAPGGIVRQRPRKYLPLFPDVQRRDDRHRHESLFAGRGRAPGQELAALGRPGEDGAGRRSRQTAPHLRGRSPHLGRPRSGSGQSRQRQSAQPGRIQRDRSRDPAGHAGR